MNKILLIVLCLLCVSCSNKELSYKKIGIDEAYYIINSNPNVVILDVRDYGDYEDSHIENAINMPYDYINKKELKRIIDNYETNVIIYSSNNLLSENASIKLIELGYKNIYTFGKIEEWTYNVTN